ncbi:hypothetical protein [Xylanibacter muris]|uniref:Outer membrane protein beta-barrel domain-containing protein n=1 Tax=Xylanibacter muris TaxID=2736290 RepID=A0ABX2APW9_9BACT|nr:hypothetical protein [Xylanibacter muris]NPD93229.1 hypothetical protein [Xylanibacter muris]
MRKFIVLAVLQTVAFVAVKAETNKIEVAVSDDAAVADSLSNMEDGVVNDTLGKSKKNYAKGFNALDYVMGHRYLNKGETFGKKWYDHIFIEAGAGVSQMLPPVSDYHFNPLTTASMSIGKQISKVSSLRLGVQGAFGFQHDKEKMFYRYGMKLDYIYSLSSYIKGYNPSRFLDVSAVVGAGGHYARYSHDRDGFAPEAHLGMQFKFFTGARGYVSLEPYVSVAGDKIDLSQFRNDRKVDYSYGANLSFIYYLNNNLSPESRRRLIRKANRNEQADSVLPAWRAPWFMEFASGISFLNTPDLNFAQTAGHDISFSVGKWFSSVVGLRLTGSVRTAAFDSVIVEESYKPYHPEYRYRLKATYTTGRIEAMFNPLGFRRNYSWNENFGFYIVAGGEIGRISKNEGRGLRCLTTAYSGGLHLWAKLVDDVSLFIEPRYTFYEYKIPYSNLKDGSAKRFSDDIYSVNVGLAMTMRTRRYRNHTYPVRDSDEQLSGFAAGLGGGLSSFVARANHYPEKIMVGFNGVAYGEYHFNNTHGIRLSYEFVSNSRKSMMAYYETRPGAGSRPERKRGLWNHRYFWGFTSLDYQMNVCDVFSGHRPGRKLDVELFFGPTLVMLHGENSELHPNELLPSGSETRPVSVKDRKTGWGGNVGLKVVGHLSDKLSLFASPTVYAFKSCDTPGNDLTYLGSVRLLETVNVGVQYNF